MERRAISKILIDRTYLRKPVFDEAPTTRFSIDDWLTYSVNAFATSVSSSTISCGWIWSCQKQYIYIYSEKYQHAFAAT